MKDKTKKQQISTKRPHKIERKRIILLIVIMTVISLLVVTFSVNLLYRTALEEGKGRLVETVQSQARLVEAIARYGKRLEDWMKDEDPDFDSSAATLSQIIDAHANYRGFGETGEFTLARREEDEIVFLLRHRHFDLEYPRPVAFNSELAEPMRRALLGQSGTVVGLDYRAETVLAAHEPVAELDLGIVAKIDMAEIRSPFIRAGLISFGIAVFAILFGAVLFVRVTNPIIKRVAESEERLDLAIRGTQDGLWDWDIVTNEVWWSPRFKELLGYRDDELSGSYENWELQLHPDDREKVLKTLSSHIEKYSPYDIEYRLKRKSGEYGWFRARGQAIWTDDEKPIRMAGSIQDITDRKKIDEHIKTSLREKEVLLREIHHRVKNNLQVIISLLNLQSQFNKGKRINELLQNSQNRIRSMALIHEMLYQSKDITKIDFRDYIMTLATGLFQSYETFKDNIALNVEVKDVAIGLDQAIYCGLIINELVSNSLEYAFPDGRKGEIKIIFRRIGKNEFELIVSDNGVRMPKGFDFKKSKSLGLYLVKILAEEQLHGEIKLDKEEGTKFQIKLKGVK